LRFAVEFFCRGHQRDRNPWHRASLAEEAAL
jgi:hypothetical protein